MNRKSDTEAADHPFHLKREVVAKRIGDAAVLIHLRTNRIYELNPTGTRIWELLNAGWRRSAITRYLCSEFDVSVEEANQAVDELLSLFSREELTETHHE
jgi:hypothetical protein